MPKLSPRLHRLSRKKDKKNKKLRKIKLHEFTYNRNREIDNA